MGDTVLFKQAFIQPLSLLFQAWFLWLPLILFLIFRGVWLFYVRSKYLTGLRWVLLEIKVPQEVAKSPKAMESIFTSLHGLRTSYDLVETYLQGIVTGWFSFEIVGNATGVHFYIWTQDFFRKMIEAQIYAQYPTSEISAVDDYTSSFPQQVPNNEWDLWGMELALTKPDAYPIRTYEDFNLEKLGVKEEEQKIDPLAALTEFLGNLKQGENIWIQFLVRPATSEWKKEGEKLIEKISGEEAKKNEALPTKLVGSINNVIFSLFGSEAPKPEKKERSTSRMMELTPGQKDVLTALENNVKKHGFDTGIRWMYLARRDVYNPLAIPAVMGIFQQFASSDLNGFKPNKLAMTTASQYRYYIFRNRKAKIIFRKKARLFNSYRLRSYFYPPYSEFKPFVLSTSELATMFHFPGMVASAPTISRITTKKGAPPPNLPI